MIIEVENLDDIDAVELVAVSSDTELEEALGQTLSEVLQLDDDKDRAIRILISVSGESISNKKVNGGEYLDVPIMDRTGSTKLRVWDGVDKAKERFIPGSIWLISVTKTSWNDKPQITFKLGGSRLIALSVEDMDKSQINRRIKDHVARIYQVGDLVIPLMLDFRMRVQQEGRSDLAFFFDKIFGISPTALEQSDLYGLPASFPDVLDDEEFIAIFESEADHQRFKTFCYAPAAKRHHGNFIHGLLEHSMQMMAICDQLEQLYENSAAVRTAGASYLGNILRDRIDFRLMGLACIIHDYYKVEEYTWDTVGNIESHQVNETFRHDMRMAFKLQSIIDNEANHDVMPASARLTADKLSAIIMTHHGPWSEYKHSEKLKSYPEIELFHMLDLLDTRIVGTVESNQ